MYPKAREYLLGLRMCLHKHKANVVIVRWVGRNKWVCNPIDGCGSITLFCLSRSNARRYGNDLSYPINCSLKVTCSFTEGVCFSKIPHHRNSLTRKCVTNGISTRMP